MRFGYRDWQIDDERQQLSRGSDLVAVGPQVARFLSLLIRNRTRVVSGDEIEATLWPNQRVSASSLGNLVFTARRAIGDDGRRQSAIRTITGEGYRFVGEVQILDAPVDRIVEAEPSQRAKPRPPAPRAEPSSYRFDRYELNRLTFRLLNLDESKPVSLEPRVFELILYLVQHRERVVAKSELIEWQFEGRGRGSSLAANIHAARKALGDSASRQDLIRTVHGRGYQFVAEVQELSIRDVAPQVYPCDSVSDKSAHRVQESLRALAIASRRVERIESEARRFGVGQLRRVHMLAAYLQADRESGVEVDLTDLDRDSLEASASAFLAEAGAHFGDAKLAARIYPGLSESRMDAFTQSQLFEASGSGEGTGVTRSQLMVARLLVASSERRGWEFFAGARSRLPRGRQ